MDHRAPTDGNRFRTWLPMLLAKSFGEEENGLPPNQGLIGGVVSTETCDLDGETIVQDGLDWSFFLTKGILNYNHRPTILGEPIAVERRGDATYLKGALYLTIEKANEIYTTAKGMAAAGAKRSYGFSIEGVVLERDAQDPRRVTKAAVYNVSVCEHPKNGDSSWVPLLNKSIELFQAYAEQPAEAPQVDSLRKTLGTLFPRLDAAARDRVTAALTKSKDSTMNRKQVIKSLTAVLGRAPSEDEIKKALDAHAETGAPDWTAALADLRKAFDAEHKQAVDAIEKGMEQQRADQVEGLKALAKAQEAVLKGLDHFDKRFKALEKAVNGISNEIEPPRGITGDTSVVPSPAETKPQGEGDNKYDYEEVMAKAVAKVKEHSLAGNRDEALNFQKAVNQLSSGAQPEAIAKQYNLGI